ncbi:hypothetical protein QR680_013810 [Steinernema hermaphroditum]|uniref:Uncharacterized protein n=1 Tax=Steinernema hermaphroditum TaxID=289476 RepID=A0AA39I923_9BILA|nr:hypothetical protein QR680_013810 [Steinernema hermaphroditum]
MMKWKRRLFNQCILPALLYASETWALTKTAKKKLATAQRRMERRMIGVRLLDKKSNEWLRGVTKLKDVVEAATRRKWTYGWRLANDETEKWSQKIESWRPHTTRPHGRPRRRWRDDFCKTLQTTNWRRHARRVCRQEWCDIGMKTLLILSVLVGISLGAPLSGIYSFKKIKGFPSREEFPGQLESIQAMVDDIESIPKEIRDLVNSITVDDYDGVKAIFDLFKTDDTEDVCTKKVLIKERFPELARKVQNAVTSCIRRIQNLSLESRRYLVNAYLIADVSEYELSGTQFMIYYLQWPKEVRDEIEQIFPSLSKKANKLLRMYNMFAADDDDDDTEFRYPHDVPDCTAPGIIAKSCSNVFDEIMDFDTEMSAEEFGMKYC